MLEIAKAIKRAEGSVLHSGTLKPRISPFSFHELERAGLEILREAREVVGLPVVTKVVEPQAVDLGSKYADIL